MNRLLTSCIACLLLAVATLLPGCGQKGPLTLPEPPPASAPDR